MPLAVSVPGSDMCLLVISGYKTSVHGASVLGGFSAWEWRVTSGNFWFQSFGAVGGVTTMAAYAFTAAARHMSIEADAPPPLQLRGVTWVVIAGAVKCKGDEGKGAVVRGHVTGEV